MIYFLFGDYTVVHINDKSVQAWQYQGYFWFTYHRSNGVNNFDCVAWHTCGKLGNDSRDTAWCTTRTV